MAVTWKRLAFQDELHSQGTDVTLGAQVENLDMNTHKIVGVVDPTTNQEAATKKFVDDAIALINKIIKGDTSVECVDTGDGYIIFKEDGVEVGRFSGGNLTLENGLTCDNYFNLDGNITYISNSINCYAATDWYAGRIRLRKSASDTKGAMVETSSNEVWGFIQGYGVNSSGSFYCGADIQFKQDGTAGATYLPGKIHLRVGTNAAVIADILTVTYSGVSLNTHKITDVVDPTADQDAATKKYVDTGFGSRTTASWSKSIGSGGDYATWAAMISDIPDLIANNVTVTVKAGTTLNETCNLYNKHGLTTAAIIQIKAEKYFPTLGVIPTVDSATSTTLRDAALVTAAKGDDYFNGCWVIIVDGTGTDNGYVPITDYVDSTGDVVVASWPGTQPDNTSRYLIVGALIDGQATRSCLQVKFCTCPVDFYGIGFYNSNGYGIVAHYLSYFYGRYNAVYQTVNSGLYLKSTNFDLRYNGVVKCNTGSYSWTGGIYISNSSGFIFYSGISDNNIHGVRVEGNSYAYCYNNFGDNNGVWGVYAISDGQARCAGTECSGSSGNHSDTGTAGTASRDQASAY